MVGAIADWFAVTALFKHPLGLPIPHTALIPKRKDELGRGLRGVRRGELPAGGGHPRARRGRRPSRCGSVEWLEDPAHVRRVVDEVAEVAALGLGKVRDDHVEDLVRTALVPRFREEPISPLLGGLLAEMVADDLHHGLVDLALDELHGWLRVNRVAFTEMLSERAPWWAPPRVNEAVTNRIHLEVVRWIEDIRSDPAAPRARRPRLDAGPARARPAGRPRDAASGPSGSRSGCSTTRPCCRRRCRCGRRFRHALLGSLQDPTGAVRARLQTEVSAFGARLRDDAGLPRAARPARRRRRGLRGRALRRRDHHRHHAHHRALGRQGGLATHRAARRARPAVHPHQRHDRRRPGRRADPHVSRCCSRDRRRRRRPGRGADPRGDHPAGAVPQARRPGRPGLRREGAAWPRARCWSTARSRPAGAVSWSRGTS